MNNFDTVREALEAALSDDQPYLLQCGKALTALAAIEADHFTSADMASAAAQGFRDGVASVAGQEPVGTFWQHPKTKEWYQQQDGEPLYRASPVAQQPQAKAVPPGYALVPVDALHDWKGRVNTLATLGAKADRYSFATKLKQDIADAATQQPHEQHLLNLLARIHGDGGHYTATHGLEKSVADADQKVADLRAQQPQAEAVPSESAVVAGARVLNQRAAEACGVNADDQWAVYAEAFKDDVRAILAAAQGAKT